MKNISKLPVGILVMAILSGWANAATPAHWETNFTNSLATATAQGVPIVVFWGHLKCTHCNWFVSNVKDSSELATWVAEHPVVLAFKDEVGWNSKTYPDFAGWKTTWPADYRAAYEWLDTIGGTSVHTFPKIGLYWKKPSGDIVKNVVSWGDEKPAASFVAHLDRYLGDFLAGVQFAVGTTPCDRLEAVADTKTVDIPLERAKTAAATTRLVATFPNGGVVTNEVDWAEGVRGQSVALDIPDGAFIPGAFVSLALTSEGMPAAVTSLVAFVEEPENSPKNPRWIGERDLETLAAGEWTMDLDLVKARASERGRPSLVIVGGSPWCPDCVKTDHYLVNTEPFKEWLKSNDVSCAAIDVPTVAADGTVGKTSLLTYAPTSVSDRYVNSTDPKQERVQSGAGYLSRHQIPQTGNGGTNATKIAARNLLLLNSDTEHGGFCRPENLSSDNAETQRWKTGIPCLILLRPDGTATGRLYQFNNVSPGDTSALDAYLRRMDELVALCDEPGEEANADWRTTGDLLGLTTNREASVSAIDLADWYRLETPTHCAEGEITVKALESSADEGALNETNLWLRLVRVGSTTGTVATVKGNVFAGVTLPAVVKADEAEWFVEIRAIDTSAAFALDRATNSIIGYSITTSLENRPSAPVFERAGEKVPEKTAGTRTIQVLREGGVAGVLHASVVLDVAATTASPGTYEWENSVLEWADGDAEPKIVKLKIVDDTIWDGDRQIVLRIADISGDFLKGDSIGPTNFVEEITEDDKMLQGKLAITATDPAMAKTMTVVAREGSVLDISVERLLGAATSVTCDVATAQGTLSSNVLVWTHLDRVPVKHVELAVPMIADLGKKRSFTVTITPQAGAAVDKSKRKLTVNVVTADSPGFEVDTRRYAIRRYVSFADEIAVSEWKGGRLVLKKLSGSLPTGVKAKLLLEGGVVRLVLSGTPTKAKDATVAYQITEQRPKADPTKVAGVAGTTVRLVFSVSDITVVGKDGQGANAFVAKTRTFGDIPVVDAAAGVLAGRLTVTVPKTGKLSAKYLCRAGTIAFTSSSWAACDDVTGTLTAVLKPKKAGYALAVTMASDGTFGYEIDDVDDLTEPVVGTALLAPWNKTTRLAKSWTGLFTVDCPATNLVSSAVTNVPTGDAWFTLKMNTASAVNAGKMTYAGRLANGKSFSGSAVLRDRGESAGVPVVIRTATDYFTAYADIAAEAAAMYTGADEHRTVVAVEGVAPRWRHSESWSTNECHEVTYGLYGAYYDAKEDIEECARTASRFGGVPLWFTTWGAAAEVSINVEGKGPYIDGANPIRLSLKFKRATGVLSGTFMCLPEGATSAIKVNYAGILLPGWGGCGACAPGEVFRPLFAGSFWRTQKVVEQTAAGKRKSHSVVRGGAIAIGESVDGSGGGD